MIDIVMPCSVNNSNKIELITLGQVDMQWSPNWSSIFGVNKALVYDIISDKSLLDNEVTINVGHTNMKLNDFKFIFKLNGIHSNCKLYYDSAVVNKLVTNSICANMLMSIIDYCESNNISVFTSDVGNDTFLVNDFVTNMLNGNIQNFTMKFVELSFNDIEGVHCIGGEMQADTALSYHKGFNNYIINKNNKVKRAGEYACNKIIDLLQLDKKAYDLKVNKPIPPGPMAFVPVRPNFTRSTLFNVLGNTIESPIEGYSSSILYYKCKLPITISFILYSYDNKITISNLPKDFRPIFVRAKDSKLNSDITNNLNEPSVRDLMNNLNNSKMFEEIPLCFDLFNKAFKALTAGDLIYFYAITSCTISMDHYSYEHDMVINDLTDDLINVIKSYDIIGLALGGVRTDRDELNIS